MRDPRFRGRSRALPAIVAAVVLCGLAALPGGQTRSTSPVAARVSRACPPGYVPLTQEGETTLAMHAQRSRWCINSKHPEAAELAAQGAQQYNMQAAPNKTIPRNAYIKAIRARNRILKRRGQSKANRRAWTPYGRGPLQAQDYPGVNGLGLVDLAGRITDFAYVPPTDKHMPNTLLASVAYGGVWKSTDLGKTWTSISNRLPTQIVGSVNYTPVRGGRVIAVTGDGSFGRYSREGAGVFWTSNGKKWHRARGVPSDVFGFNVAVDQHKPQIVYVATGGGLFRSTNGGGRFRNVKLPTGPCAGKSNRVKGCLLANEVTDVVVQAPGGSTDVKGGAVLAAVGWRDGSAPGPDGKPESPNNGLYFSPTGKPGSFQKLDAPGFAPQDNIGRTEFGPAIGPDQDHNYVYASVQDAQLDALYPEAGIDAAGFRPGVPTVWRGLYVSSDFGQTWTQMYDSSKAQDPSTGSALSGPITQGSSYGPGVQSWYNMWVQPDPTMQAGGVPTRLLFGLEEVWQNDDTSVPQTGPSSFHVIGRYFGGSTCLFLNQPSPDLPYACPTNRGDPFTITKTTHPDQHSAIFVPQKDGSSTLVVGNDGGVYTQTAAPGTDFDNEHWGDGANKGFHTLFPYDAEIADDGTVWMGLQDNGTAKIQDTKDSKGNIQKQRQIEALGGDGFFVGVDPRNSDLAYGEYTYGAMSGTNDGGKTWNAMSPPGLDDTTAQFSNPFAVDPNDPLHVLTAGNQIDETGSGPGTSSGDWAVVYHLGTYKHPGDPNASASAGDPLNSMTAIDLKGSNAYVGFCGSCDVLVETPFHSGLATNVGGSKPPKAFSSDGWHIAKAKGLPNRYITAVESDPKNPRTVYVSVGGYRRYWTPPGELDTNKRIGKGHLFVSHDAGAHFTDISANLPNYPVNWVTLRGKQLIVATDVGVFTAKKAGRPFQVLGRKLPMGQVSTVELNPCDRNQLVAAAFGRGVYTYRFPGKRNHCPPLPPPPTPLPLQNQKVAGPFTFETDSEGWTDVSAASPGWQDQPPGNNSSRAMAVSPYQQDTSYTLVSPKLTLPGPDWSTVKVTWAERRDTEPCCDFLSLQWSSNGHVWTTVEGIDGQNPDYPNFTTVNAQFAAPPGDLYIRFILTSDQLVASPPYTGVAVDDVLIER